MTDSESKPAGKKEKKDIPVEEFRGMVKRAPVRRKPAEPVSTEKTDNKVIKMLDKNPLGMTLPEMAGGPRKIGRIRTLRPMLAAAIKQGLVMPVSQRSGHTVYRLVKHITNR
ncbi:hypothetical protein GC174_04255 [bacterium]|nr:hypothetical protein [bacterium]